MSKEVSTEDTKDLRYLDAKAVECPSGKLDGLNLVSGDDQAIGAIDGVLIDPATRKLRYFVVERARMFNRRRYLVSADGPAVMIPEDRALRVEVLSDNIERQRFDSRSVPVFSDDDLLTSLFARRAS